MYIGIDIGGTKCAVLSGDDSGTITFRSAFPTTTYQETRDRIFSELDRLTDAGQDCTAIGVSCGGPLDESRGLILSPPNLPGWDNVPIVAMLEQRYHLPAALCNDANAGALAEWKFGAGRGTQNMIFLTCGTGMGAGLMLNGALYSGANGMAGEVGHMRLAPDGPVGYGKPGSFEGFCSGGGIKQIGQLLARQALEMGMSPAFCPTLSDLPHVTAKNIAQAALAGDATGKQVYETAARKLGEGVAVLIDLFNPECIVIGSIFARSESLLRPGMEAVIEQEALSMSRRVCRVVPAALGEKIGDYAALAVADMAASRNKTTNR